MSKDILNYYGSNTSSSQASTATNGGRVEPKDVMSYKPPVGPKGIGDPKSPGLHGTNHGCAPGQGKH